MPTADLRACTSGQGRAAARGRARRTRSAAKTLIVGRVEVRRGRRGPWPAHYAVSRAPAQRPTATISCRRGAAARRAQHARPVHCSWTRWLRFPFCIRVAVPSC